MKSRTSRCQRFRGRSRAGLLAILLTACSTGPAEIPLGRHESPCTDDADCGLSLYCVELDAVRFCTEACDGPDDTCPSDYACDVVDGVCYPTGVECRRTGERCGAAFGDCCLGRACTDFPPYGTYCAKTCVSDGDCSDDPSACCIQHGARAICVPGCALP